MKKLLLSLVALLFICNHLRGQTWTNVQGTGSINDDSGNAICTDSLGNSFVAGSFSDSIYFGAVKVKAGSNSRDIFIVKYNSQMNVVWAKRYGGTGTDDVFCIKTDIAGNIYVAGVFYNSITLDTITLSQVSGSSVFIAKFNSTGDIIWAKSANTPGGDFQPSGIGLDQNNYLYISGYYVGAANFGNGNTITSINHPTMGASIDIFIARYSNSGICQWARSAGSYQTDRGLALAVAPSGDAYITGFYGQTANFSGNSLPYIGGGTDAFIAGYNSTGNLIFLTSATSTDYEAGYGIAIDALTNIYITGLSGGATHFDTITNTPNGSYDMFIAKYNVTGAIQWVQSSIGSQWEQGRHVAVDLSGNVYVGGEFYHSGTTSFPVPDFTSMGYYDPFVVKYNRMGEFQWAQRGGSFQYEYLNGMSLSNAGRVCITGSYGDASTFGSFSLAHTGGTNGRDYFVARLQNDILTTGVLGLPACAGSGVAVSFSANIPFNSSNIFTAQLSDSKGRFANATSIGSLAGTISGTIQAVIPGGISPGSGYRIRVISSDSVRTGSDNGTDLIIWGLPVSSITSPGTDFCSGDSLKLSASTGSGYSWKWKKGSTVISGATSQFYYAKTTADYKVIINEPLHGCSRTSNIIHATSRSVPAPAITPAGATTFCSGGNVLLNANTGSNLSYQWKKNGSNISNATSSSYTTSVSGNFTVKETTQYGCTKISAQVAVLANPLPVVSYSGLAAIYNVNDAPVTLTPIPNGGVFNGSGITGYTFFPSIAGVGGPYSITYSYTDGNGCSNAISHQTSVVCTLPVMPGAISMSGGISNVCPGDSRTYSIASVNGASSYSWIAPAGSTISSGQGTLSVTINFGAGFTLGDSISVKAVNACGQSGKSTLFIQRNNPSTPVNLAGQSSGVCNLSGLSYSVSYSAGITYAWSFVSGNSTSIISGQGTSAIGVNYLPGFSLDTLRVSANNACGTSSYKKLTIKAVPSTPGAIAGSTAVCANQQNVPYSISPVANTINYTWNGPSGSHISDGITTSPGNTLVTTANSITVNYGASGGTLKVKAGNSCGFGSYKSKSIAIVCRYGAEDEIKDQDIYVSPNPSSGDFNLQLVNSSEKYFSLEIVDAMGRKIFMQELTQSSFLIPASLLAPGMYFAVINTESGKKVAKIIKTN